MIINQGLQSRMVKLVTSNKKMLECMTPPPPPKEGTPLYGIYRNVKIQKMIAKHIFECFEKRKGGDGKATLGLN